MNEIEITIYNTIPPFIMFIQNGVILRGFQINQWDNLTKLIQDGLAGKFPTYPKTPRDTEIVGELSAN